MMRICIGLLVGALGSTAFASGTYVAPPPKPKPKKVDCSLEENKDHRDCKAKEVNE